jgi:hypothetical protein
MIGTMQRPFFCFKSPPTFHIAHASHCRLVWSKRHELSTVWLHFVVCTLLSPLVDDPNTKRLVFLFALGWHDTMAILLLKLDQLFTVLVSDPFDVVVLLEDAFSFPSEPDFVQEFLSIKSKLVRLMKGLLPAKPKSLETCLVRTCVTPCNVHSLA